MKTFRGASVDFFKCAYANCSCYWAISRNRRLLLPHTHTFYVLFFTEILFRSFPRPIASIDCNSSKMKTENAWTQNMLMGCFAGLPQALSGRSNDFFWVFFPWRPFLSNIFYDKYPAFKSSFIFSLPFWRTLFLFLFIQKWHLNHYTRLYVSMLSPGQIW